MRFKHVLSTVNKINNFNNRKTNALSFMTALFYCPDFQA